MRALIPAICVLTLVALAWAEECGGTVGEQQHFYHAPARFIPFQPTNPKIKRGFLELFRHGMNHEHNHGTPQDPETLESICRNSTIRPEVVTRINSLLAKNDTLTSFSDRNLMAVDMIVEEFLRADQPEELLEVIKTQLNRHAFNPRAWYNAVVKTMISRGDLNGILLPWPVDATPDLYVTHSIISKAREGSRFRRRERKVTNCTTGTGLFYPDVRYQLVSVASDGGRRKREFGGYEGGYGGRPPNPCNRAAGPAEFNKHEGYYDRYPTTETPKEWGWETGGYQGHQQYPFPNDNNLNFYRRGKRSASSHDKQRRDKRQVRECLHYNGTTGASGEENRLWYFREDMWLNQHHWYWHQYYPKTGPQAGNRDRRGEIFFFAHHSIIARYNAERSSNGLPQVTPLEFREFADIGEGYQSDMIDENTGRFWTYREPNTPLRDIIQKNDPNYGFNMRISQVAESFETLRNHIRQGYLWVNRSDVEEPFPLSIQDQEGLSHLGNTVEEAPRLSTNKELYLSAHSLGHLAISVATDPDFRCNLLKGVMADVAVAMRDPAFYKVHSLVDTLYTEHKNTLPPYQIQGGHWPLQWDGVTLQSVEVMSGGGNGNLPNVNNVNTFWSIRRFPLEEGIDGSIHEGDVKVDVCHQHLDHEPFMFKLVIDVDSCAKSISGKGMVRIFLGPRHDVNGRRFTMEETRNLLFQLDVFPIKLHRGRNTITRYSQDSSATKPWPRTLTEMLEDPENGNQTEYCGCGWPRHLYIPKGSPHGTEFDLFAMVTNFDQDQVLDPIETLEHPEPCNTPYIYCGRPGRRYPDARPMGYPFDRVPFSVYENKPDQGGYSGGGYSDAVEGWRKLRDLEDYVSHVSNMQGAIMLIRHLDRII